jgi:hypothetical protein
MSSTTGAAAPALALATPKRGGGKFVSFLLGGITAGGGGYYQTAHDLDNSTVQLQLAIESLRREVEEKNVGLAEEVQRLKKSL